jgi:cytochrome c-type biogenesis protein CcmH/NrfG
MTRYDEAAALFEGKPVQAEQALEQVVQQNPKDAHAWLLLGAARLKLNQQRGAVEAFRKAQEAQPGNRAAMVLLAHALEQTPELTDALKAWQQIANTDPTSKDARDHVARLADLVGQTEVALQARRELVKLVPGNPELAADLALYLVRARKFGEAVKMFERTDMLEPGFVHNDPVLEPAYRAAKAASARG